MRVRLEVEKQIVKNPYAELMVARTLLVVIRCFVFCAEDFGGICLFQIGTSSVYCVSMHFAKVAVRKRIPIGNYTFP